MRFFKSNQKQVQRLADNPPVDPDAMEQPTDPGSYILRGYAYYGTGRYAEAAEDFKRALDLDSTAVDAVYALGMCLKAAGKKEEAAAAFKKAIALIDQGVVADKSRARILRRLAKGHINEITNGDWNLEAEIWQHVG